MEKISPDDVKFLAADEFCKKLCIQVEPYDFEVIIPALREIGLDKIDPRKHFKSYINLISKFAYSNEDDLGELCSHNFIQVFTNSGNIK